MTKFMETPISSKLNHNGLLIDILKSQEGDIQAMLATAIACCYYPS